MIMALVGTKRLIDMGMEASRTMPALVVGGGMITDANLWIAMQGFTGAYYAIWESLFAGQDDDVLRGVLDEMYVDLWAEYQALAGGLRIDLSHKGFTTTTVDRTTWETDYLNDTEHPVYNHAFATIRYSNGEREIDFAEWARHVMGFWYDKIIIIERTYNQRVKAGWTPPPKLNKAQRKAREEDAKAAFKKLTSR